MAEKNFIWTDEEITLLLGIVTDYKAGKAAKGLDWSSIKTKIDDLTNTLHERYPDGPANEFPHKTDCEKIFTKERVKNKLKRIRSGYKKAVDSGRKSGGGRIVATFYDECSEIWAGSPAVESTINGIESSLQGADREANEPEDLNSSLDMNEPEEDVSEVTTPRDETRRSLLKFLNGKKDDKLNKRLSTDKQLIAIANEELTLKRKVAEKMEESEKKYQKTMDSFAEGLKDLTTTLNSGFKMVGSLLNHSQATPSYHGFNTFQQPHFGILPDFSTQPDITQEYTYSEGENLRKL